MANGGQKVLSFIQADGGEYTRFFYVRFLQPGLHKKVLPVGRRKVLLMHVVGGFFCFVCVLSLKRLYER